MNRPDPAAFCRSLALLFSPPDGSPRAFAAAEWRSFFRFWTGTLGADLRGLRRWPSSPAGDCRQAAEYGRLFSGPGGGRIPLVESVYKPWTQNPACPLPFAGEKGFLFGDPALHMLALYRQCGLEIPEEFQACPDHLALELEFLACLYGAATHAEARTFIADHLDWIPDLQERMGRRAAAPLYHDAVTLLRLFLTRETKRWTEEGKWKEEIFS